MNNMGRGMVVRVACRSLIVVARVLFGPPHTPAGEARRRVSQARQVLVLTPDTVPGPAAHASGGTCQAGTFRVCTGCWRAFISTPTPVLTGIWVSEAF